tara:strand:- start:73 stop:375 length:303 start_codon:yes stop_codon:yes gene_type:complete
LKSDGFCNHEYFKLLVKNLPSPPFENSFAYLQPEAAAEWDYKKNKPFKPSDYLPKVATSAWFICSVCGHSWKTQIATRSDGHGCPKCGRVKQGISRKKIH